MSSGNFVKRTYHGETNTDLVKGNIYEVMFTGANEYATIRLGKEERHISRRLFTEGCPEMYVVVKNQQQFKHARIMLEERGYVWACVNNDYNHSIIGVWAKEDGTIHPTFHSYADVVKFRCDTKLYEMKIEVQMNEVQTFRLPPLTGLVTKEQALEHIEQLKKFIGA